MINRQSFYTKFKLKVAPKFTTKQYDGFEAIFNEWESEGFTDLRWLSYILATAWHETAKTMQPIEEYGKGMGKRYGSKIKHSGVKYSLPDKLYFGRGFVQLTWYENYQLMGRLLGIDLLNKPELALNMEVAIKVMFEGMTRSSSSLGDFTGKCLEQYFNTNTNDPIGSRRIINGKDKAELIAQHYHNFLACL